MTIYNVLLHHDSAELRARLETSLRNAEAEFHMAVVPEGESILAAIQRVRPHVLVLGVQFVGLEPNNDTLRTVRRHYARSRLCIVALGQGIEMVDAAGTFGCGADVCVPEAKLDTDRLVDVIALRAANVHKHVGDRLQRGRVILRRNRRSAEIDGDEITLTPAQFSVIWHIVDQCHRVVPAAELMPGASAFSAKKVSSNVQILVHRLRGALGEHKDLVETVRGLGYRAGIDFVQPER